MNAYKTYNTNDREANQKARIATIITAMLLLLSLVLITFSIDAIQDEEEEGILVNFGTSSVGSGSIQPQQKAPDPIIKPPKQDQQEVTPTPPKPQPKPKTTQQPAVKQKEVLTQKPPSKVISKPKQTTQSRSETSDTNNDSQKEVVSPTPSTNTTPSEPNKPVKPAPKQPERTYGGKKDVPSPGEGNDNLPGDKGQPDGSPDKGAYDGKNSGLGDSGVGYSLSGRKLIQAPSVEDNSNIEGKVTVNIKVDQNGNVISASLGTPTTISNNSLIQKSIQAARRAKFDKNKTASEEQFGTMTFIYRVR